MHHTRPGPGDTVRIRGERWRIAAESPHEAASIIDVEGCDATNRGVRTRFILPVEPIDRLPAPSAPPRVISLRRWRHVARASLASATPHWTSLRLVADANLTIIPFQLEPALAAARGDACRILIADEVGLGKTIQAGLLVADTLARMPDAHILIVSPAGLRDQWRDELRARFSLQAEVLDGGGVARTAAHLAPGVNPWAVHPIAITSIDFVKRPDVMRSLDALLWDVVVFDEAHSLSGRSDRAAAASGLACRARCVVMLTATPHSGDDEAFGRLCALGDLRGGFPLITFRRTRADIGLPHGRRSILLRVRPEAAEIAMHDALAKYTSLMKRQSEGNVSGQAIALVAAILTRRACSSASSLARSLERRMTLLADQSPMPRDQLPLPFVTAEHDDEPGEELGVAGLRSKEEERDWLERLFFLARAASFRESKIRALRRLLARASEAALVFTEYRDTLQHLAAALADFDPLQLHGGLTASDRRRALHRFAGGNDQLLLATDAASEGLNLHHRCRLVVNLELPWTPARLEQRIGRVDRFGQHRRVHAVQLVSAGSPEEQMADRLDLRSERIQTALRVAALAPHAQHPALSREAQEEGARLQLARTLSDQRHTPAFVNRPIVAVVSARQAFRGTVWVVRVPCVDAVGGPVFETVIGLHDARSRLAFDETLNEAAAAGHQRVLSALAASIRPFLLLLVRREEAIIDALRLQHARLSAGLLQRGLFERRAERAATAQASILREAERRSLARLAMLGRLRDLRADSRAILFGIAFR